MSFFTNLPLWSISLTVLCFLLFAWLQKKTGWFFLSPIIFAGLLMIGLNLLFKVPIDTYRADTKILEKLITPATICLGVVLYQQLQALKGHYIMIIIGSAVGIIISIVSVVLLCLAFNLDRQLAISLLPKSVTSAIGLALSDKGGGIGSLTVAAIVLTGNICVILSPIMTKLFKIKHPIAKGVALGTAAHLIGTSKASEEGQISQAASTLSLVLAGIIMAVVFPLIIRLI